MAANGLRLVLDEHRTTATPTLKSAKAGKTKSRRSAVPQHFLYCD